MLLSVAFLISKAVKVYLIMMFGSKVNLPDASELELFEAVSQDNLGLVIDLIAKGANVNAINNSGWSVLQLAISVCPKDKTDIIEALISCGVNLNTPCEERSVQTTPFRYAISKRKIKAAQLFVSLDSKCDDMLDEYRERLLQNITKPATDNYFYFLDAMPLGTWPRDLVDIFLSSTLNNLSPRTSIYLLIRVYCEKYAREFSIEDKNRILEKIEEILIDYKKLSFPVSGAFLPFEGIHDLSLLKIVYLSENEALINLFLKYLPIPSVDYFKTATAPNCIKEKENENNNVVGNFLNNRGLSFSSIEERIKKIQRQLRSTKRQEEEQQRIFQLFQIQQPINNFGSIYVPQRCSPKLAKRIIEAAGKIKFLNYIRHITKSEKALKSIFDDGFFGRKNLLLSLLQFEPASLDPSDVHNGDANAIFFGSDYGHIAVCGAIELMFELDKIIANMKSIHCAFFKQLDFGASKDDFREVLINKNKRITFRNVMLHASSMQKRTDLVYYTGGKTKPKQFCAIATLPNYQLISYDIHNINAVLILNFFRFLDKLEPASSYIDEDVSWIIDAIYKDIEEMDDETLILFLKNIGMKFSDMMEFNFFGAHQINFDSLLTITKLNLTCLNLPIFIEEIQSGNLMKFESARKDFPFLFQSYRFLDFLSYKTEDPLILNELAMLRVRCKTPGWYPLSDKLKLRMQNFNAEMQEELNHQFNSNYINRPK